MKRATVAFFNASEEITISIHALVKRATRCVFATAESDYYFNPRPREEGDCCSSISDGAREYFNPRPREEGDDATSGTLGNRQSISIHALVKRATAGAEFAKHSEIFQSTPS